MQVNILQCQSNKVIADNLSFIEQQLASLPRSADELQLVVLPESVLLFGGHEQDQLAYAGRLTAQGHESELKTALSKLARQYQVYLVAGTIPAAAEDGRVYSRCYLFDLHGAELEYYDKLHLFDVQVADETKNYRESDTFCAGNQIKVIDTPFGRLGLANRKS